MQKDVISKRQKEAERAQEVYRSFKSLQSEKATCDAGMKEAKIELEEFYGSNKDAADEKGTLWFEDGGKVRYSNKGVVRGSRKFSVEVLMKEAPELVNLNNLLKYAISGSTVKALGQTPAGKAKLKKLGLSVSIKREFVVE